MDREDSETKKLPIPKFTSFRPKTGTPASANPQDEYLERRRNVDTRKGAESGEQRHRYHESHSRSHVSHHSREGRQRRHEDKVTREDRHGVEWVEPRSAKANSEGRDHGTETFVEDRKGDRHNLTYGTLHRYSIPNYYRSGRGNVLGLSKYYKIDRDRSEVDSLLVGVRQGGEFGRQDRNLLGKLEQTESRLMRVRPEIEDISNLNARLDFIPLNSHRSRKRRRIGWSSRSPETPSSNEETDHHYRSIEGQAKAAEEVDEDLEALSATSESDFEESSILDPNDETRKRSVQLARQVEQQPADLDGWLELIKHQDALLGLGFREDRRPITNVEKRSLADVKISIYEKALKRVGPHPDRDHLILDLHFPTNDTFIRQAGFSELAVALWQAVLEFNIFRPDGLDFAKDSARCVSSFTAFWESEVARTGEEGAKGWKNAPGTTVEPKKDASEKRVNEQSIFETWAMCESERSLQSRLPARTLDDVEEDDPYRVILSSDIKDCLLYYSGTNGRNLLINGFLAFCRLPPLPSDNSDRAIDAWWTDPFLRNELLEHPTLSLDSWLPRGSQNAPGLPSLDDPEALNEVQTKGSPLAYPMRCFATTVDTIFSKQHLWYSSLDMWGEIYSGNSGPLDLDWMRRVLRNLVDTDLKNDNLAEYFLALELKINPKEAKKYAKALLKKRPSSLRLYNAYALIERRMGNASVADHVWTTALSMSISFTEEDQMDSILLWRSWIWELLQEGNSDGALRLLLAIPDRKVDLQAWEKYQSTELSVSLTALLKAQQFLTSGRKVLYSLGHASHSVHYTECLSLLTYLNHSFDINIALEVYKKYSDPATNQKLGDSYLELLHQARARLLFHHVKSTHYYKPSLIRNALATSIKLFPSNTIFLSLYDWNETRFRIDDRVRSIMRELSYMEETNDSIISPLFSIFVELQRGVLSGSTIYSARAAFEKAVDTTAGKSSASLWKLYLLVEVRHGDMERAKNVFYRGMRACPWAKALIMLAFTHLREITGFEELRKIYNVLVEKELRVHVDLEDAFEKHDECLAVTRQHVEGRQSVNLPEDASSDDEMRNVWQRGR